MQHVRLSLTVPEGVADEVYDLLTRSPFVESVRGLVWNFSGDRLGTLHYVEADSERYVAALEKIPLVLDHQVVAVGEDAFYAYHQCSVEAGVGALFETFTRGSLLVVPPAEFGDGGTTTVSLFGDEAEIQAAIESVPEPVTVEILAVNGMGNAPTVATATLSDRQREAVTAALDLGYYEVPREASNEAVAERLDCAPSTAAEHLRKAESKLLQSVLG